MGQKYSQYATQKYKLLEAGALTTFPLRMNKEFSESMTSADLHSGDPLLLNNDRENDYGQAIKKRTGLVHFVSSIIHSPYTKLAKDVILLSFAFAGLLSLFIHIQVSHKHFAKDNLVGCSCGDSVAEAISRGCKFDPIFTSWMPEHCRDEELITEFNKIGDGPNGTWLYFADAEHKIQITEEEAAAKAEDPYGVIHMNASHHKLHCIYAWRKEVRYYTGQTNKLMQQGIEHDRHVVHCGEVLMNATDFDAASHPSLNADE